MTLWLIINHKAMDGYMQAISESTQVWDGSRIKNGMPMVQWLQCTWLMRSELSSRTGHCRVHVIYHRPIFSMKLKNFPCDSRTLLHNVDNWREKSMFSDSIAMTYIVMLFLFQRRRRKASVGTVESWEWRSTRCPIWSASCHYRRQTATNMQCIAAEGMDVLRLEILWQFPL
jgi:hypothetical protein